MPALLTVRKTEFLYQRFRIQQKAQDVTAVAFNHKVLLTLKVSCLWLGFEDSLGFW